LPWATARSFFCEDAVQTSAMRWFDFEDGITNDTSSFNFATGPNGAIGMEILQVGGYRIWSSITFDLAYNTVTNARDFTSAMFFDYTTYVAALNNTYANGINLRSLESTGNIGQFYTSLCIDIFVYDQPFGVGLQVTSSGPPYNVIELGLAQDTGHGGCWENGLMIYKLDTGPFDPDLGDFTGITYLPWTT